MAALRWILPACQSALASTTVDSVAKWAIDKHSADVSLYTDWLVVLLSITTLPPLLNAPGGILQALNVVPWWWSVLFGYLRLQWTAWQVSQPRQIRSRRPQKLAIVKSIDRVSQVSQVSEARLLCPRICFARQCQFSMPPTRDLQKW